MDYNISEDGRTLVLEKDIRLLSKDADVFKKIEVIKIKRGVNVQYSPSPFDANSTDNKLFPNIKKLIQEEPFPSIWSLSNEILDTVPILHMDSNEELTELVLDYLAKRVENFEVNPDNPRYSTINGMLCSKNGKTLIRCPANKYGKLVIPDGIEIIEKWGCSFLKSSSVKFPNSLTTLYEYAFSRCSNLHSVDFGQSNINIIPEAVFSYCFKLKAITIPDYVHSIEDCAFYQCIRLEDVTFPKKLEYIGDGVFESCIKLKKANIPVSVDFIGRRSLIDTEVIYVEKMPKGIVSAFAGTGIDMAMNRNSRKQVTEIELNGKKLFFPKYMKESVIESLDENINNLPQQLYTKGISDTVCQDTAIALYEYNHDECVREYLNHNIGNILYRITNNKNEEQLITVLKLNIGSKKALESLYKKVKSTLSVTANAYFLQAIQDADRSEDKRLEL